MIGQAVPSSDLVPPETVERILISSTSRFIAEYQSERIVITHVWPGFYDPTGSLRREAGPLSRSAFMLSFIVPEVPRLPGQVIPTYNVAGERVCSLLSLLYGKRFDAHGAVQSHGDFMLPHLGQFNSLCKPELAQNDYNPRSDISIPLDLRQVAKISPMLTGRVGDESKAMALNGAAKFYWQALQNVESDPEVAYLHLITAGEILSNSQRPESADALDDEVRTILDQVRQHVPCGERAANILAGRMRQIKKRFRLTVEDLIDGQFFSATNGITPQWKVFQRDSFLQYVSAAYDVRSKYVHSGWSFDGWIAPRGDCSEEVRHGIPEVEAAPTYVGLERVIRYCMLRFAERHQLILTT
jgi:hypothetical protein